MIYRLSRRKLLIVAGSLALSSAIGKSVIATSSESKQKYQWGMVIDVTKCTEHIKSIGLDKKPECVIACHEWNNVPEFGDPLRDPQWIRIIGLKNEFTEEVFYFPLFCQHCVHPACAEVCLSKAAFRREEDGIVLIDYHRCIGCRYCIIACPYNVRSYNWYPPEEGLKEINPETQTRGHGIVEKCTFCVEIVDEEVQKAEKEGRKPNPVPKCVEACPFGALVFGNLLDPESEISKIIAEEKPRRLREEFGTEPNGYYIFR